jgi:hypothetical protein
VLQADVDAGRLSSAQLETLVYANMRFNGPRQPGAGEASLLLLLRCAALAGYMHAVFAVLLVRFMSDYGADASSFEHATRRRGVDPTPCCRLWPAALLLQSRILCPAACMALPQVRGLASSWVTGLAWARGGRLLPW